MARGDLVIFEEARSIMFLAYSSGDDIKCAIITGGTDTAPTAADADPKLGGYTEVTDAGSYTAGGTSIGDWESLISEAGGVVTFDSATNPTWAQNSSNGSSAFYGLLYNDTHSSDTAFAYVDLGGPVDMTAGDLTITWNSSGIFKVSS
jgi:hypothetical protein